MTEQTRDSRVLSVHSSLILVVLTAGVARAMGVLFLRREPFGDAYCYIEQTAAMRREMLAGTFTITDLYGFWLPLYQLVSAIFSLVVNQPVYVARFLSAATGVGVCVLVYLCSHILTSKQRLSLVAALMIALNPFHLQYSAAAMTDVPHALLVLGCMYFVLTERWTLAACMGAAACLIRLESWMLVAALPTLQFIRRRTMPIRTTLIVASGPALWLFICWQATGNPFASFQAHDHYMALRLTAHPEFSQLPFSRIWKDLNRLVYSVNLAILAGCLAGLWLLIRDWRKAVSYKTSSKIADLLVCLWFFFSYLGFIATAYLTKNNTDIWHRYGLILFSLGLPVLAYSAQQIFRGSSALAKTVLGIALLVGFVQIEVQTIRLSQFAQQREPSEAIANYLKQEYASDPSVKIFCDDPAVRVTSGLPPERFYLSYAAPTDREGFLGYLRTNGIKFLVVPKEVEASTPSQLFPNPVDDTGGGLEGVIATPDAWRDSSLYRVRPEKLPPPG